MATISTHAFELGGTAAVGMVAASIAGVHPLLGASMAAVAYVVSQVAEPVFKTAPNFEDGGMRGGIAHVAVWTSCAASIAQLTQWLVVYAGYAVRVLPSFGIVGSALALGPLLGESVQKNLNSGEHV